MRFRIPPQHKETVTIVCEDAYERGTRETVAEDVVCMIQPITSGIPQRDATQLREGIPVAQAERVVLLSKPDTRIKKGHLLIRADSSEFRILDVLQMKGSSVMRLYLRGQGVL
jgi:hypothetical protein